MSLVHLMMFQWWLSEGEEITWCWWHHYNTILGMEVISSDQQLITFHIVQPLMPCWSVLWVYVLSIWVCISSTYVQYAVYMRLFWLCSCCTCLCCEQTCHLLSVTVLCYPACLLLVSTCSVALVMILHFMCYTEYCILQGIQHPYWYRSIQPWM